MWEPVRSLVHMAVEALARAGAELGPPAPARALADAEKELGLALAPSWRALLELHDGAVIGDVRVLAIGEALAARGKAPQGMVPAVARGSLLFALDHEHPDAAGEWAVVEIAEGHADPSGTNLVRFLLALLSDGPETRAYADPEHAEHWLDWAHEREDADDAEGAMLVLRRAVLAVHPASPTLLLSLGERELLAGRREAAWAHLRAAIEAEGQTAADDGARQDAAAQGLLLARELGDAAWERRCAEALGDGRAGTAQVWRENLLRAWALGKAERARQAARVVLALAPEDADAARLQDPPEALRQAAANGWRAFEALAQGETGEAIKLLRRAVTRADLGLLHARLAYALSQAGQPGAADAARRATELNPTLVEAWFELGDALLSDARDGEAERALRRTVELDPGFALAWSKLAVALLNQGRGADAVAAARRGADGADDPAFAQSVLGDVLMDQGLPHEAAAAYERSLAEYDGDHWTLHQAALATVEIGDYPRAGELFERALEVNPDGCHQTLIDYADLKRRMGRIGDAVKLYREAVKAAPGDPAYKRLLREAQKEREGAPN